MGKGEGKVVWEKKKGNDEYFIEERYEGGVVLEGSEMKWIGGGKVNLKDWFGKMEGGEVFVQKMEVRG